MSYFQLQWFEQYLPNRIPKAILDVGSYNGKEALQFSQAFPEATIIAFEADPILFHKITTNNILANSSVQFVHAAVCEFDGEVDFFATSGKRKAQGSILKPADAIFRFEGVSFGEPVKVPAVQLATIADNYGLTSVDLLHMDIQGAEYKALVGLGLLRPTLVFLEVNALAFYEGAASTFQLLTDMGYNRIDISHVTQGDELWVFHG
jgi:FkbM family methyltransferase